MQGHLINTLISSYQIQYYANNVSTQHDQCNKRIKNYFYIDTHLYSQIINFPILTFDKNSSTWRSTYTSNNETLLRSLKVRYYSIYIITSFILSYNYLTKLRTFSMFSQFILRKNYLPKDL